jgi:anti-sigma-K factor RskA
LNIQEYISSGVIEAYLLGNLSQAEQEAFENHLSAYPELKKELHLAETTLEKLVMAGARAPRVSLKEQIRQKALARQPEGSVVPLRNPVRYWQWAAAASVAFALLTSLLAYTYRQRWVETRASLDNLIAQNQQIAQNYNVVNERLTKIQNDFAIIENSAFQKVVMKGTEQAPAALASVYWNPATEEVYLSIQQLKSLAAENQFQLWAVVDGKPVDAGVFDAGIEGLLKMKNISGAVAFAVTIEPRGGKPAPTLETMQVMGAVPKS